MMVDLRVAIERCLFLADRRGMGAVKRVGGSRTNLDSCDGAAFDVCSKAKTTYMRFPGPRSCMLAVTEGYTGLLRTCVMFWWYQGCKFKDSAARGDQIRSLE